ncbi:MAG: HEPN domain-containing protein [Phycisphaerales bacterium]|nr:MAG: HEPN domain-containing protein [Phycisphaerales bacterium]
MVDADGQIDYWRRGADEDWEVAARLVKDGKSRHGLFSAHLALEKTLKALVCRRTRDIPPRIHNLVRLGELAGLEPDDRQADLLADMNQFNIEGRYPEFRGAAPDAQEAADYLARSQEVLTWLTQQF